MFFRRATRIATYQLQSVRKMGGHHAAPQEGLDGAVRKVLKEDHHVVLGILGFYTSLYFLSKIGSGKKKEVAVTETHTSTSNGEMPSVESPEFEQWISTAGNLEKLFA